MGDGMVAGVSRAPGPRSGPSGEGGGNDFSSSVGTRTRSSGTSTMLCNFRCSYCFLPLDVLDREHPTVERYSIEHIKKRFDDTGREWLILISGGEPFLY